MRVPISVLCWLACALTETNSCVTNDDILIDIMFVVDGSGSIGKDNFDLVKVWLANATETMFHQFGHRAQLGVLQYSDKDPAYKRVPIETSTIFEIPFRLGECKSASCLVGRIKSMQYLSSQTFTYYAMRRVLEVEFPLSKHAQTAKKAIILMTDGAADDAMQLPKAYDETVRQGITNFAIGVSNYRIAQLKVFANGGNSDERVFVRADFNSLSTVLQTLEEGLANEGFFCDECASATDNCDINAECIDTVNGFDCACKSGFYGDGFTCENIDDCWRNPCPKNNSYCVDGINSFQCLCQNGFRDNGFTCENIDDCQPYPCEFENSKCVDRVDHFICICQEGFELDRGVCRELSSPDPPDQNNLIMIICFALVVIAILVIVGAVICITRREHVFTPREPASQQLVYQTTETT